LSSRELRQQRKKVTPVALVIALALAGCGKSSVHKLSTRPATASIKSVCKAATQEIVRIDDKLSIEMQLEIQAPKPGITERSVLSELFRRAAEEGQEVTDATLTRVRHLAATSYTPAVLANLATDRARLLALARKIRTRDITSEGGQQGLVVALVKANSGCGRVTLAKPATG
jgi:hypothetical protein